ncbi:MAG TPA: DUF6677 family protein [Pyrinomonadaceae bacterium]|nr:DUF6677 family protein [Pyrinomonadaceae bacterium]
MSKDIALTTHSTGRAWLAGALTWAIPGAGHLLIGKTPRGLILGGVVLFMFALGLLLGGHLYGPHNSTDIGLLAYVYGFCNLGLGAAYAVCLWAGVGLTDQAARATAEYGNVFLIVAGLLNYLSMLDAFDIAAGRKA